VSHPGPITQKVDWRELLASPDPRAHTVQLYSDAGFLASAVSHYAATGLRRGEAVIIVATPEHRQDFTERLRAAGINLEAACSTRQLIVLDAAETLARCVQHGKPEWSCFEPVIGSLLDQLGGFPRVRAYGEMVNLFWENGDLSNAIRLEELWNELGQNREFALHCAYAMDNFQSGNGCHALCDVNHTHTHVIPVEDYQRLDRAVHRALAEVLGPAEAVVLRSVLAARNRERMPEAQAALIGLSKLLPGASEAIVSRARRYYQATDLA
jgi:hypothetical protein